MSTIPRITGIVSKGLGSSLAAASAPPKKISTPAAYEVQAAAVYPVALKKNGDAKTMMPSAIVTQSCHRVRARMSYLLGRLMVAAGPAAPRAVPRPMLIGSRARDRRPIARHGTANGPIRVRYMPAFAGALRIPTCLGGDKLQPQILLRARERAAREHDRPLALVQVAVDV